MLTPEDINSNWHRYYELCTRLGDRSPAVTSMLDELDERLCLCPASAKRDFHGAFPGGLVDHSLRVLNHLIILNRSFSWKLPKESMIIAALFHDVGKVGMPGRSPSNDFYVDQVDNWRREKMGEVYKYNDSLPYMTTPDRSLFLLQHYGVQLTADESLAVKLNDGFSPEENKPYCLKVTPLVYGLMTSDYVATMVEKRVDFWPTED